MHIRSFSEFINESWKDVKSDLDKKLVGVVITCNNQILLVRGNGDDKCSIPKGKLEEGEDITDGALRELEEETGIKLTEDQISDEPEVVDLLDDDGNLEKQLIYFTIDIEDLSEYCDIKAGSEIELNKDQLKEIEWAGLLPRMDAYSSIKRSQHIILDRNLKH